MADRALAVFLSKVNKSLDSLTCEDLLHLPKKCLIDYARYFIDDLWERLPVRLTNDPEVASYLNRPPNGISFFFNQQKKYEVLKRSEAVKISFYLSLVAATFGTRMTVSKGN